MNISIQGKCVTIDPEDFNRIAGRRWSIASGYAASGKISMHRFVLGLGTIKGGDVDHINGNKLDNRKENLRHCSRAENLWNSKKSSAGITSRFKGVTLSSPLPIRRTSPKWEVNISRNYQAFQLGRFHSEIEAAYAYDCAALILFGAFARTNFDFSKRTFSEQGPDSFILSLLLKPFKAPFLCL